MHSVEIEGELIEVGEFHDEPGHCILIETGKQEVFVAGLSQEDVAMFALMLFKKVKLRLQIEPADVAGETP